MLMKLLLRLSDAFFSLLVMDEAMAEYKAILEKGRQNNRKRSEKMRELRMSDPEYRAKMEEKERLALEREKKRQERATKKKKIALAELKEQAEKGNQEAVRELEERRAIARERSRKSAEKRKQRAENDPEYAKYLEERNAEYNRRHTARRKEQMEALRARAEAGDQEAQSQLAERKQYQVRATVKSYRSLRVSIISQYNSCRIDENKRERCNYCISQRDMVLYR